jgi:hypothetical protein
LPSLDLSAEVEKTRVLHREAETNEPS